MGHRKLKLRSEMYFAVGQGVLALCLVACIKISPQFFFTFNNQGGISNYGAEPQTAGLYVLGFAGAALGALVAAYALPRTTQHYSRLRSWLYVLAALWTIALLSTFSYKLSESLRILHEATAAAVFVCMIAMVWWLRFWVVSDRKNRIAFVLFCLFLFIGLCSALKFVRLLFLVEIGCGLSFGYMVSHGIRILTQSPTRRKRVLL